MLYNYIVLLILDVSVFIVPELILSDECKRTGMSIHCGRIPGHIPNNVTHVFLEEIQNVNMITAALVNGSNWENIKFLQISDSGKRDRSESLYGIENFAMTTLERLEELQIVSVQFDRLYKNSFAGLDNLKVLNFTGCLELLLSSITNAIGRNKLPRLEVLSMTYVGTLSGVEFDKKFFEALAPKPLKLLDAHQIAVNNRIRDTDIKGILDTIQYINMSDTNWPRGLFWLDDISVRFQNVKLLNLSNTVVRRSLLSTKLHLSSTLENTFNLSVYYLTVVSNVETVDISGIYNLNYPAELHNITVYLADTQYSEWKMKNVILKNNKLKHLDVTVPCYKSNLESLDFSLNDIEFLHPRLCPCCYSLQEINLSNNKLFKMAEMNSSLFSELIISYPNLKTLKLSSNRLKAIPYEMFQRNGNLETIDLSDNSLTQVTFNLKFLFKLKILDLQNNKISILNQNSLMNLQSLFITSNTFQNDLGILKMVSNPISCSGCHTLASTKWLSSISFTHGDIVCSNPDGSLTPVDNNAVAIVQEKCDRPIRIRNTILWSTLLPLPTIILIILTVCTWRRYRRQKLYKKIMDRRIRQIQMNELETKYLVFLSFSSYDYNFLNSNVYGQLKRHLQEKTGTDRDLICFGDKNFQLGKPIHDEMVLCLQQSAVVMLLLSRNFCNSEFCRMEFDMALFMKKPFILMMKEELDEKAMVPSLQELFKRNTRLLWEREGNNFNLRTSWDNVCDSVLQLVP